MTNAPIIGYAPEATEASTDDTTPIALPSDADTQGSNSSTDAIPEKFRKADGSVDVERLMASYAALEAKMGSSSKSSTADAESSVSDEAPDDDDDTSEEEVSGSLTDEQDRASSVLEKAGLSLEDVQREFDENGELSEETYKALQEKAGFPRELVESYVAGLQARVDRLTTAAFDAAGGEDVLKTMTEWAADNADEVFIEGFNAAVQSQDPKKVKKAVESLKKLYDREAPKEPQQIAGEPLATDGSVYKSDEERSKDMDDPRYETDERYRKMVEDKIRRTLRANGKA